MTNLFPTPCSFENKIHEMEEKLVQLRDSSPSKERDELIEKITAIKNKELNTIYSSLSRWDTVQVARHPQRPKVPDYIAGLLPDYIELSGDRLFRDDPSIMGAIGTYRDSNLMIIGHNRGTTTKEKIRNNFGMASPEGYHKAIRLMHVAEKFNAPILTLIDTQGAYPGVQAEEMGQSAAIAQNLREMFSIRVPIICVVIGEGGSGGALGIGVGNYTAMFRHSIYSVISPEGCASILWRDASKAELAAEKLQLTAKDLLSHSLIDAIIEEPLGGAQRNPSEMITNLDNFLSPILNQFKSMSSSKLLQNRHDKYRHLASIEI